MEIQTKPFVPDNVQNWQVFEEDKDIIILAIYVHDLIIASSSESLIWGIK